MAALAADRNTKSRNVGNSLSHPVAATTVIYGGSLVMRNAAGNAIPGADTASCQFAGVAKDQADNNPGAAGDTYAQCWTQGEFKFVNGDTWTIADVGTVGYISDDQTVAKVGTTTNDVAIGPCIDVDSDGVWFRIDGYAF